MLSNSLKLVTRTIVGILLTTWMFGCSGNSPVAPTSELEKPLVISGDCPNCTAVNFSARVSSMEQNMRQLTFEGVVDTVTALQNCEIYKLAAGLQIRVQFGDIRFGDSVEINGQRHANGAVVASQLRIMDSDNSCGYDLAFRDTIATVDYAAGTFTVRSRGETITTDVNTTIWGTLFSRQNAALNYEGPNSHQDREQMYKGRDTLYAFNDLQVGDIVEVKANIINESTLLAVKIKIANCNEKQCITFTASIASIDAESRSITFDGLAWLGWVCPGAEVLSDDGSSLDLSEFAVGDQALVKGLVTGDDGLKICLLTLVSP